MSFKIQQRTPSGGGDSLYFLGQQGAEPLQFHWKIFREGNEAGSQYPICRKGFAGAGYGSPFHYPLKFHCRM
ncbi:MAG: hypothetical protein DRP64_17660, partial [Verrucomicrobia bacterium]